MSDQARVANRLEIGNGDSLSALEAAVLDEEVIAESTPNEKAKLAETLKNVADARSSNELVRIKRSQLRTTAFAAWIAIRSEEHTSELQSRLHLVCRLLLEKKKSH